MADDQPFPNPKVVELALRRAANRRRRIHAALGLPIVVGRGDRAVYLNPVTSEEIPPEQVDAFLERAKRSLDE